MRHLLIFVLLAACDDALTGSVEYTTVTNNNSDCSANGLNGCVTKQDYSGTRPPT